MMETCATCKFIYRNYCADKFKCLRSDIVYDDLFELNRNVCEKYEMIDRLRGSKNNVKNNSYINKKKK